MQPSKTYTLAIADDHVFFRQSLTAFLNSHSFRITIEADNGAQLIHKLSTATVLPDFCLLDINMPVMNGYDTMIELRNSFPSIKVIAVSMVDGNTSITRMLRNGASGYISKSDTIDELFKAIESINATGYYHSEITRMHLSAKNIYTNDRELEFLALLCEDLSYKQIAQRMNLSTRTIEWYRETLSQRFDIKSRNGLIIFALQQGLITLPSVLNVPS